MAYDIFGKELVTGDVVVYSDVNVEGNNWKVSLDTFIVVTTIDEKTALAVQQNGEWAGEEMYLVDTHLRAALVENVFESCEVNETSYSLAH